MTGLTKLLKKHTIVLFFLWFAGTAIPLGFLMSFHLNALPSSSETILLKLVQHLEEQPKDARPLTPHLEPKWKMIHLLGANCQCSEQVAQYLQSRKPQSFLSEKVIVIGNNEKLLQSSKQAGFDTQFMDEELAVENWHLEALPLLLILKPDGALAYHGAYSKGRLSSSLSTLVEDLMILKKIQSTGIPVPSLPIFGCANGHRMKKITDPLHLKY